MKDQITFPDFIKLDLRVGVVLSAEMVQGSERLIKTIVDLGPELGKKQIIAGMALWYKPEDLINKRVIVIANLEPRKMMGLESQGMILAAGDKNPALLSVDQDLAAGAIVR